ncbi:MAG TPA: tyrosine-type recombinase/integrase [Chitinophagaceae bacterium]|nr:tyrosine-type recombinase/integrase [Chitinophagaceae bacterium]
MKENQFMSILFWLYSQKTDDSGKAPIYCRITLDGNRTQFSTAKRVEQKYWNSSANKVSNKCLDAIAINEDLETIKGDLRKVYNQLCATNNHVTGDMVKRVYTGKDQEKKTIMDLFKFNNALWTEKYKQKKAALKTVQRFATVKIKMTRFLQKEYNVSDKPLSSLDSSFAINFHHYLTIHESLIENTINIYLRFAKQVFKLGVSKKWIDENPFKDIKTPYRHPTREILSMSELNTLASVYLPNKRLCEVRDAYVFSCYTGFAYVDASNLSPDNIVIGMDGNKWAKTQRQKTGMPELVPLLPPALEIIEKYKDHSYCVANNKLLPILSNQKYNKNLKEIAKFARIKKNLTTHIARHTFATTILLDNDVPLETTSKLLGHNSIRSTQIYAKVTLKKLSNNMSELRNKLFGTQNIAKTGS